MYIHMINVYTIVLVGCPMDVFSEQAVGAASMIMNSSPPR